MSDADCPDSCATDGKTISAICVDGFCSTGGLPSCVDGTEPYPVQDLFNDSKLCCPSHYEGPGSVSGTCHNGECVDSTPHAEVLGVFTDQNPTPTRQCNSGSSYKVRIDVTDGDGFALSAANSAPVRFCISSEGQIDYDSCYSGNLADIVVDESPIDDAHTCFLFALPNGCTCTDGTTSKCLKMTCDTSGTFPAPGGQLYAHVSSNDHVAEPSVTIPSPNPDGYDYHDFCKKYVRDCTPEGGGCGWDSDCCISDDLRCRETSPHGHHTCVVSTCGWYLEGCDPSQENPCCGSLKCRETSPHGHHTCVSGDCAWYAEPCQSTSDCCGTMQCIGGVCGVGGPGDPVTPTPQPDPCDPSHPDDPCQCGSDKICSEGQCVEDTAGQCSITCIPPRTPPCHNPPCGLPDIAFYEPDYDPHETHYYIIQQPRGVSGVLGQNGKIIIGRYAHVSLHAIFTDNTDTEEFKNSLYLTGNGLFDYPLGKYDICPLLVGTVPIVAMEFTVPSVIAGECLLPGECLPDVCVAPGLYNLKTKLDSDGDIAESDETNNVFSAEVELLAPPDLRVQSLYFDPPKTEIESRTRHTLTVNIANDGSGVDQFQVKLFLVQNHDPSTAIPVGSIFDYPNSYIASSHGVPIEKTMSFDVPPLQSGEYQFMAVVDPEDRHDEGCYEDNNVGYSDTITIIGDPPEPDTCDDKPDLVIGEITEAPDTVQAGSSDFFHVKASLQNAGLDLPQGASFKGQVWIVGGSPRIERSLREITYAGHVPDELSFFVRMPSDIPTGSYQFKVSVDVDSDIDECDEDNNEASKAVTVVPAPDLVVDSITVAPGSVQAESCGYFRIKADIRNEGADLPQGASFKGQVWIAGGSPRIERSLREITYSGYTGTLPELSFLVQIPDDIPTGSYQFKVSVDADNDVDESNEANNDAFRAVTVVAAPDLIIESVTPPDPVLIGRRDQTLTARIRNQGSLATGDFKAGLYVVGNSHRLSLGTITGLGPGESRTETINVIPPLNAGFVSCDLYRLRLEVDTEDVIDESCEHNNAVISSPVTFIKNKPDLVVDFLTPPNPVLIGSDQTLTARIRNRWRSFYTCNGLSLNLLFQVAAVLR